jgi:hypothetical protein
MTNPIVVARRVHYRKDGKSHKVTYHRYWCPGCDALHSIAVRPGSQPNGASWGFTGTLEKPTYTPSQLSEWNGVKDGKTIKQRCHTFIREGMIQFLNDCTHALKGQTVPLPPLPDWVVGERDAV